MKQKNLNYNFISDSKKGISIMIGYVLLITFAVIMGAIIYQWMKTYVPKDSLDCPDDVSVFIKDVVCEGSAGNFQLILTLKNSGMFNIAGYFIHAANETDQELATIDLSQYITQGGTTMSNSVVFNLGDNEMKPNQEKTSVFDITEEINSITIIPVRFQTVENKKRFVSCSNSKIKEKISCGAGTGGGAECGDTTCDAGETCASCPADCGCSIGYTCIGGVCTLQKRIIFVSSANYDGDLGGTSGADTNCSNLASAAGLSGTFKAWLSNSTKNIRDYLIPDDGIPFYLSDNITRIADNATDLLNGTLQSQINIDEQGNTKNFFVWTGTNESGYAQQDHCSDWTSNAVGKGLRGDSTSQSETWTNYPAIKCDENFAIYCFQISGY